LDNIVDNGHRKYVNWLTKFSLRVGFCTPSSDKLTRHREHGEPNPQKLRSV